MTLEVVKFTQTDVLEEVKQQNNNDYGWFWACGARTTRNRCSGLLLETPANSFGKTDDTGAKQHQAAGFRYRARVGHDTD